MRHRRPVYDGGRGTLPDANPNPSGESVHGNDDHPLNHVQCADCKMLYHRKEVRVWTGNAYICNGCDKDADKPPTEEDDE